MAQEKRVNYFQGMMLVDQDFKDDQYYHRQMRHNHNLELHTWGVVRGLDVSIDKTVVSVTEGLAIDATGKEIWWTGGAIQPAGSSADGSYLVVESAEELRDTYPQMTGKYLRVIDTAKFSWKNTKADGDLVLAVLTQGQPDPSVRRNASSVRVSGNSLELRPLSKDGSLRVMIGTSERLTIAPTGNVGIGTTDPQARLHLKFPEVPRGNAAVLNLEGTDHVYMQFFPLGFAAGRKAWMGYESANEKNFKIKNEYSDGHLLLASGSGKVGIGTSKPGFTLQVGDTDNVVDARLCVAGKGDTGNFRQWTLRTGDKADATVDAAKTKEIHKLRLRDEQGAADRLVIDQDGNVGIGLTNPLNPLEVRGSIAIRSGILKFMDEKGDWYQDNWIGMSSNVEGTIATKWLHIGGITDASARRLALYADITYMSGKLGIGTTTPQDKLQVGDGYSKISINPSPKGTDQNLYDADYGTSYLGLNVIKATNKWHRDADGTTNNGASLIYNTIKGQLCFVTLEPGAADLNASDIVNRKRMVIDERGVGIGTSDLGSSKFKIAQSATDFVNYRFVETGMGQLEIVGWGQGWNINAMSNEKNLYLNRDSAEKSNVLIGRAGKELFVRGSNGNVGIGTADPGGQLELRNPATDVKVKFGGTGADVHHLSSTRDLVFNASSGGFAFRKINSYGNAADFTDLLTISIDGTLGSPMWRVATPIQRGGALPMSASFTSGGGTLVIFVSGSGRRGDVGTVGMDVYIDGVSRGGLRAWTNEVNSHHTFVPYFLSLKLPAKNYTVELKAIASTVTDVNDYFSVTILELPF